MYILLETLWKLTLQPQFKPTPVTVEGTGKISDILFKCFPFSSLGVTAGQCLFLLGNTCLRKSWKSLRAFITHIIVQRFLQVISLLWMVKRHWILISSMWSSVPVSVQLGNLQISNSDRVLKGTCCTCSSDTFPSQKVSQVWIKYTDKLPPWSKVYYLY